MLSDRPNEIVWPTRGAVSAAVTNRDFVREAAEKFGSQCIVVAVDAFWRRNRRAAAVRDLVGMGPNEETSVPLSFIQTREITLTGTFRYANTYPTAIDLAATGKVDLDAMVTSSYGLPQTEEALQASGKDPANVKPMVIPNGT